MGVSNSAAITAVILSIINECIKIHTPNHHMFSLVLAIVVSFIWFLHNHMTYNSIGLFTATFFLGLNLFYMYQHVRDSEEKRK